MKILYICSDLGIPVLGSKGASVHVRSLIAALTRTGHEVVLAAPVLTKSPWESPAQLEGTLLHLAPSDQTKEAALALKDFCQSMGGTADSLSGEVRRILYGQEIETRLIRRFDDHPPDLIYERGSLYATVGIGVARALGRPLIVELNAPLSTEQSIYRGTGLGQLAAEAERWTLTHCDALVVVSESLRDHALAHGVEPRRIHLLPNGVDPRLFRPDNNGQAVRDKYGLGPGPILGFVGGLRPWHGVDVLPELLARLLPHFPQLKIMIVGEGPLRGDLQNQLAQRSLSSHAVLTGAVPHAEMPQLIRLFDVAVAPYRQLEHAFYFSPLKLFEYMACGAAVVAPQLGQIEQIIQHEQTGLLYRPGELDAMVSSCKTLLSNSQLRQQIGQQAAHTVHSRYTWDRNAERVVSLAQQLLTAHGISGVAENIPTDPASVETRLAS